MNEYDAGVVAEGNAGGEGTDVIENGDGGSARAGNVLSEAVQSVFFVFVVGGFADAVAVKDEARAFGESHCALGVVAATQAQRESALGIEETGSAVVDQKRTQMSGAGECDAAGCRIKDGVDEGDKFSGGKVLHQQAVQFIENFGRSGAGFGQRAEHSARRRHEQSGGGAFSGNIGENQSPAAIGKWNEVVPISADSAGGDAEAGDGKAGDIRRCLGQESLLNGASFFGFAIHGFALGTLGPETVRVIDGYGDVSAEGLQKPDLLAGKGIQIGVRRGEDSDKALADKQRNRHLGMG